MDRLAHHLGAFHQEWIGTHLGEGVVTTRDNVCNLLILPMLSGWQTNCPMEVADQGISSYIGMLSISNFGFHFKKNWNCSMAVKPNSQALFNLVKEQPHFLSMEGQPTHHAEAS